jgi:hypothetical protein
VFLSGRNFNETPHALESNDDPSDDGELKLHSHPDTDDDDLCIEVCDSEGDDLRFFYE